MVNDWKNKVVLVTGGAKGIGEQIVRALMRESVEHVTFLDIAEEEGYKLQNELNAKHGNKVKFIKCDVGDEAQYLDAIQSVVDDNGCLDILVNNAGMFNESVAVARKVVDVNYGAIVTSSLKALELMREDHGGKGGTIINISSIAPFKCITVSPNYGATKSACLYFGTCIGMDDLYQRTKVRVVTICFGVTKTNIVNSDNHFHFDKDIEAAMHSMIDGCYIQKPESAAQGVIDVYKQGESSSIWLVTMDRPAKNLTDVVNKAYADIRKEIDI